MSDLALSGKHPDLYDREETAGLWPGLRDAAQEILGAVHDEVGSVQNLWDIQKCPAPYLRYLAHKLGWFLDETQSEATRRKVIGLVAQAYRERGTDIGISDIVRLLHGLEVGDVRAPWADGHRLGRSRLGSARRAGPRYIDPAAPDDDLDSRTFTFLVEITALAWAYAYASEGATEKQAAVLRALIKRFRPAWTRGVLVVPYLDIPGEPKAGFPPYGDPRRPLTYWRPWDEEVPRGRLGRTHLGLTRLSDVRLMLRREWEASKAELVPPVALDGQIRDITLYTQAPTELRFHFSRPTQIVSDPDELPIRYYGIVRSDGYPRDKDDLVGAVEHNYFTPSGTPIEDTGWDYVFSGMPLGVRLFVGVFVEYPSGWLDAPRGIGWNLASIVLPP